MANFMQADVDKSIKIPNELPILPLRNTLAYPYMVLPLSVGIPRSVKLIEEALQGDRLLGLVGMHDGSIEEPTKDQVYVLGTVARIHRVVRTQDENMQVIVQGLDRFQIVDWLEPQPYLRARIEIKPDLVVNDLELDALQRSLRDLAKEVVSLSPNLPDEVNKFLAQVEDPRHLVYIVAANARLKREEGQAILEADDLKDKFRLLIKHLSREKEVLTLEHKIQSDAHEEMDKAQREFYLRQQLKAIRKELGEEEETVAVVEEYREKLEAAKLPEEAKKETLRELKRLEGMPAHSPEYSMIRTYLDWMVELPWNKRSEDRLEIARARAILDEDHYDLQEVKDRILEFLAVRKLTAERGQSEIVPEEETVSVGEGPPDPEPSMATADESFGLRASGESAGSISTVASLLSKSEREDPESETPESDTPGPNSPGGNLPDPRIDEKKPTDDSEFRRGMGTILCFAGPPGVGKTSLGQSIARTLGRKFTRMSLGGMRDEAEIRGHRRTYIGAMPGRILQAMKRAGTKNPVFMLDEVDKIGSDWRGDPSSALLEVLDPVQNHAFRDYYLDVNFDLSEVMFIATANQLETIPGPLRDRMEIIQLEGYTENDKVRIAQQFLVPRQMKQNGLREGEIVFTEEAIQKIARDYTREAGVRELERRIGTLCRKAAVEIAAGHEGTIEVTPELVRIQLKAEKFHSETSERIKVPGIAIGLAVTLGGGDILYIEATRMKGKGELILTGQLGDIMRESAKIAHSYVRSQAKQWGIDPDVFERTDVHVHVPAGAVPKDGPSAGVAMVTAIMSLLSGRIARADVGMTGEVTLRGRVLPVGGVKMKVLAAHRAGLTTVVIPKRNEADLEDLPEEVRQTMTFVPVETIEEGLAVTLSEEDFSESDGGNRWAAWPVPPMGPSRGPTPRPESGIPTPISGVPRPPGGPPSPPAPKH